MRNIDLFDLERGPLMFRKNQEKYMTKSEKYLISLKQESKFVYLRNCANTQKQDYVLCFFKRQYFFLRI